MAFKMKGFPKTNGTSPLNIRGEKRASKLARKEEEALETRLELQAERERYPKVDRRDIQYIFGPQRGLDRQIRKASRKEGRADVKQQRLMDRLQRRAARLERRGKLEKAQEIRDIEKDIYKKKLERDYPGTEAEIAEDIAMEYDPSGRRMTAGRSWGKLNKPRRRDRLVREQFDIEGWDEAIEKHEADTLALKKGAFKMKGWSPFTKNKIK